MSSASSNQLCVRNGAGYDEMYLPSHKDPDISSEERSPSASSLRDDDLEIERSEGGSSDGLIDDEPPIQFVIGPNGLKEWYAKNELTPYEKLINQLTKFIN